MATTQLGAVLRGEQRALNRSLFESWPTTTGAPYLYDLDVLNTCSKLVPSCADRRARHPDRALHDRDATLAQHVGLDARPTSPHTFVISGDNASYFRRISSSVATSTVDHAVIAPSSPQWSGCFCTAPKCIAQTLTWSERPPRCVRLHFVTMTCTCYAGGPNAPGPARLNACS